MTKRWLRGIIKSAAIAAMGILIFDNGSGNLAGILLLGSLLWMKLDLGEDDWFSPN